MTDTIHQVNDNSNIFDVLNDRFGSQIDILEVEKNKIIRSWLLIRLFYFVLFIISSWFPLLFAYFNGAVHIADMIFFTIVSVVSFVLAVGLAMDRLFNAQAIINTAQNKKRIESNEGYILYLREFDRDVLDFSSDSEDYDNIFLSFTLKVLSPSLSKRYYKVTLDEYLTSALGTLAPVLAIGRPGRKLSSRGAFPIYATGDIWKDVVIELSKRARAIVVWPSRSNGLEWEISRVADDKSRERIVLLLIENDGTPYSPEKMLELKGGTLHPFASAISKLPPYLWWIGFKANDRHKSVRYFAGEADEKAGKSPVKMTISLVDHLIYDAKVSLVGKNFRKTIMKQVVRKKYFEKTFYSLLLVGFLMWFVVNL